jgi:uncharacterized protein YcfJ
MVTRKQATHAAFLSLALILAGALAACGQDGVPGQAADAQTANAPANDPNPPAIPMGTSNTSSTTPQASVPSGSAAPRSSVAATTHHAPATTRRARRADPPAQFAKVVAVQPIEHTTTHDTPRQVCQDEQVEVPNTYKDQHQIAGDVIGGLVGALAGHQVGGGKGKTLATIAGAAGGAFAGHEVQKHHQNQNATKTVTKNVCHTVTDKTSKTTTVGYDVTYTLNGKTGHVRMDHNPGVGMGLPVKNGVVVAGNPQQQGHQHQ